MTGQFAKPEALIEFYVADVMKRLPTRLWFLNTSDAADE